MPQKRRTLGDRNRASIALDPTSDPALEPRGSAPASTLVPTQEREPPQAPPNPAASKKPARGRKAAPAVDTDRIGIYLTPAEFNNAKAGYLADWSNGGDADTFARWIAAAIDTYASRTPTQRASATPRGRAEERTGSSRSFNIPTATVARMRAAITEDQQAGRWPSASAWCGEAIAHAVESARTRNGGSLPTPPPRLPNRLVRQLPMSG